MRARERILKSLETVFQDAYARAEAREDSAGMETLDFEYQREQLRMEVLLDLRDLLASEPGPPSAATPSTTESLLDKAEALRRITRLR